MSGQSAAHSDLVEIAKRNGDFKKNYGLLVGAFLYLRSINSSCVVAKAAHKHLCSSSRPKHLRERLWCSRVQAWCTAVQHWCSTWCCTKVLDCAPHLPESALLKVREPISELARAQKHVRKNA